MKKKILIISIILTLFFMIVATVFFFLMKNTEPSNSKSNPDEYDTSQVVEELDFLKLNTYDEIKQYADEYPIYIQSSDDNTMFGIGELYIEDRPVTLFYQLNENGSINRFDGSYSYELKETFAEDVSYTIKCFNNIISDFFLVENFGHAFYGENGAPITSFNEKIYDEVLEGKATYGLSIIDESNTYWYVTATVVDKKCMNFEFFRCFDLSTYNDDSPNLDLRIKDETGE